MPRNVSRGTSSRAGKGVSFEFLQAQSLRAGAVSNARCGCGSCDARAEIRRCVVSANSETFLPVAAASAAKHSFAKNRTS